MGASSIFNMLYLWISDEISICFTVNENFIFPVLVIKKTGYKYMVLYTASLSRLKTSLLPCKRRISPTSNQQTNFLWIPPSNFYTSKAKEAQAWIFFFLHKLGSNSNYIAFVVVNLVFFFSFTLFYIHAPSVYSFILAFKLYSPHHYKGQQYLEVGVYFFFFPLSCFACHSAQQDNRKSCRQSLVVAELLPSPPIFIVQNNKSKYTT